MIFKHDLTVICALRYYYLNKFWGHWHKELLITKDDFELFPSSKAEKESRELGERKEVILIEFNKGNLFGNSDGKVIIERHLSNGFSDQLILNMHYTTHWGFLEGLRDVFIYYYDFDYNIISSNSTKPEFNKELPEYCCTFLITRHEKLKSIGKGRDGVIILDLNQITNKRLDVNHSYDKGKKISLLKVS